MPTKKQFLFYFFIVIFISMFGCRASDCGCPMSQKEYEDTSTKRNILVTES